MLSTGRSRRLLFSVFTAAAVTSCGPKAGTDVGNGLTVKLNVQLAPEPTADKQASALAGGVVIDELWVATSKYRLSPGIDCAHPDPKLDLPGLAVADLLGEGFIGGARSFGAMGDTFCKLSFEFASAKPTDLPPGAPPELADASIFLRGHRADGVVFTVRSRAKEPVKLDAKGGSFELEGAESALVIAFDVQAAINALELDALKGDPIVVDGTMNGPALKAFDKAIRDAVKLFSDDDKDGKLGPGETDEEHELGHGPGPMP